MNSRQTETKPVKLALPPESERETEGQERKIAELEKQLSELEERLRQEKSRFLYLYSDFENFKKRVIRERGELIRFGWEPLAQEFVQVIDNLERALAHMPPGSDKTLIDGLHMVLKQFRAVLEKQGIQRFDTLQKMFDPYFHEVVAQEPSDRPKGTIVREEAPGYTMHGRLLRPARVVVSAGAGDLDVEKISEGA